MTCAYLVASSDNLMVLGGELYPPQPPNQRMGLVINQMIRLHKEDPRNLIGRYYHLLYMVVVRRMGKKGGE